MPNLTRGVAAAMLLLMAAPAAPAPVQPAPAADGDACGKLLSAEAMATWRALGGRDGRLGCPIFSEGATAASVKGSAAREARFEGGEIIVHASGPFAGKAFAVAACDRLYVQYGGASGWLGLPVSDAINTPDGQRQSFEGGTLTFTRALDSCDAERGS